MRNEFIEHLTEGNKRFQVRFDVTGADPHINVEVRIENTGKGRGRYKVDKNIHIPLKPDPFN